MCNAKRTEDDVQVAERAAQAKLAQLRLAAMETEQKDRALKAMSNILEERADDIVAANRRDVERAERDELAAPLLKRLRFDRKKLAGSRAGVETVAGLPDPSGRVLEARKLDEGLDLYRVSCPIGVIGMIFESRPDALVQMASLCLKSGNAVLLKGGREAAETNAILAKLLAEASAQAGIPDGWLQLLESREEVGQMLALERNLDLLIPRGSKDFVRYIMEHTSVPVLGHADGVTHLFVDAAADVEMAVDVADDSKTQYTAVCNALETLLVDRDIAARFLEPFAKRMTERQVELRGCPETRRYIDVAEADESDWESEYLAPILSVRVVGGMEAAIEHINTYGSGHTDAIVTADAAKAERFMSTVDSADVMWNCSTRFSDGYRYGLGAEVGISTNKIHARGPVGLEGLVIYKWKLYGSGQKVDTYARGERSFLHRDLYTSSEGGGKR
jgi:glutamate-5-semialdehyde dehydrogenase